MNILFMLNISAESVQKRCSSVISCEKQKQKKNSTTTTITTTIFISTLYSNFQSPPVQANARTFQMIEHFKLIVILILMNLSVNYFVHCLSKSMTDISALVIVISY